MTASKEYKLIQRFLKQFADPDDKAVRKPLRLSKRLSQTFFAALNGVPKDGLNIPGFAQTMSKLGLPSFYASGLKKAGLLKAGAIRGDWAVTKKALNSIRDLLKGNVAAAKAGKTQGKKKAGKPKGGKKRGPRKTSAKPKLGPIEKSIHAIREYMDGLRESIKTKQAEYATARKALRGLIKVS